ncbi:YlxR family protein [Leptolyngbya sp. FACHB-261]|nr:YlxR family protein [Leptolyngbya sp. FACHB-261]
MRSKPNYRRCLSCRRIDHRSSFWRIVRSYPSRKVQLEGTGRSAYLCPQAECLAVARRKDRLGRALKVPVPDEIYQILQQRLGTLPSTAKPGFHQVDQGRTGEGLL